ncbi:DUF6463 family protein [Luteipulveratus sp. YIM 133132]|uniref:DUF6463 family protein n=1 Tax=Luteipulveratus flavus TaxID=3031728 RepID=UPI0023B1F513|nr:DUF6463 family protein [Luteipulveratus sp. YIM 133132]MDE9365923.1 DUF6463 family protein [Luteipulveratus sp. YIM 133132]
MTTDISRPLPAQDSPAPAHAPWAARSLAVIGAVHVAMTPLLYGDAVSGIVRGGVIGQVDADPALLDERSAAFWYATAGLAALLLAAHVRDLERRGPLPAHVSLGLVGLTVWGVALVPVSGFWAFTVPAAIAWRRRRR